MKTENEIILLNVSGHDRPGLTSGLTEILAQYKTNILDIGQAVIHNELNLGILFEVPKESESSPILKELLFKSYEIGLNIKFTPISGNDYNIWVNEQGKDRFLITLLGKKISAEQISKVASLIYNQKLNIDKISRLSGRVNLEQQKNNESNSVVEFSISGKLPDLDKLKAEFLKISSQLSFDIALQRDNVFRRNRRLFCFDMDSTLIQTEVIDEIAMYANVGEEVKKITESAMKGEIDFKESFKKRLMLLKGIEEKVLQEIANKLPLTNGAGRLFKTLKKYGYKTAIISGGFTYFGDYLKQMLGIDYVYANRLEIKDGKLTGNYIGEIIDGNKKAALLKELTIKENIHPEQVIAVGDGSNDLPMLRLAGLGIAFHAKPIVKENAKQAISTIGLDAILYLIGFKDREIEP